MVWGSNNILGYTKDNGKLVINDDEAKVVRMVFDMYALQKLGMRRICNALAEQGIFNRIGNPYNPRSIRGFLTNPKYKGYYVGNKTQKYDYKSDKRKYYDEEDWTMYKDEENVPPLVSEEIWDRANMILHSRSDESGKRGIAPTNKFPYSGKLLCMEHDEYFYRKLAYYPSGNKEFWKCSKALTIGKSACDMPVIYTAELDEVMKNVCETFVSNKNEISKELAEIYMSILDTSTQETDIAKLKTELVKIEARKDKILDLTIERKYSSDEFETKNNALNADIEKINESIKRIEAQKENSKKMKYSIEFLEKLILNGINFESGFTNNLIDGLVDRIEVHQSGNKKKIRLKVFLRLISEGLEYEVSRGNKKSGAKTSVCEIQPRWGLRR